MPQNKNEAECLSLVVRPLKLTAAVMYFSFEAARRSRAFSLIFTEFLRKGPPSFHSWQVIAVQVSCPGLGVRGQQSRGFTQLCLPPALRQQSCCLVAASPF